MLPADEPLQTVLTQARFFWIQIVVDTRMVFLKGFFEKVDSENNQLMMKKNAKFTQHAKLARCNSVRQLILPYSTSLRP